MRKEEFAVVFGDIDAGFVEQAHSFVPGRRKPAWRRWCAAAAVFAVAAALGLGLLQGRLPGASETVMLAGGDTLVFHVGGTAVSTSSDMAVQSRPLSEDETQALFPGLDAEAMAIFDAGGSAAGDSGALLGFQGSIGTVKMVVSTAGTELRCAIVVGEEETSEVSGVPVTAGYFITAPNSRGERSAIYYVEFELGSSRVYLENAGLESERERVRNELAAVAQKVIDNGEPDLESFVGPSAGTGLDGDPAGYSAPSDVQGTGEVSERERMELDPMYFGGN